MEQLQLKKEVNESMLIHTLIAVNKVRKISTKQLYDIFSTKPNHLPPVVERVNIFLQKLAHIARMYKLQDACSDEKYAKKHPEEVAAVEEYYAKDDL